MRILIAFSLLVCTVACGATGTAPTPAAATSRERSPGEFAEYRPGAEDACYCDATDHQFSFEPR